jgi:hypothetical protein
LRSRIGRLRNSSPSCIEDRGVRSRPGAQQFKP